MTTIRARRNAVQFCLNGDLKMESLLFSREILQKALGFSPGHLDYIFAFPGGKKFEVIFTTFTQFENCLRNYGEGKTKEPLSNFTVRALTQPEKRFVNVCLYNEYVHSSDVETWLRQQCTVVSASRTLDEDGVKTGFFKAVVYLKKNRNGELQHLPNRIRLGAAQGSVYYVGQPKKCRRCNELGHFARDCKKPYCTNCQETGHEEHECRTVRACNMCNSKEHTFKDCPKTYANRIKATAAAAARAKIAAPQERPRAESEDEEEMEQAMEEVWMQRSLEEEQQDPLTDTAAPPGESGTAAVPAVPLPEQAAPGPQDPMTHVPVTECLGIAWPPLQSSLDLAPECGPGGIMNSAAPLGAHGLDPTAPPRAPGDDVSAASAGAHDLDSAQTLTAPQHGPNVITSGALAAAPGQNSAQLPRKRIPPVPTPRRKYSVAVPTNGCKGAPNVLGAPLTPLPEPTYILATAPAPKQGCSSSNKNPPGGSVLPPSQAHKEKYRPNQEVNKLKSNQEVPENKTALNSGLRQSVSRPSLPQGAPSSDTAPGPEMAGAAAQPAGGTKALHNVNTKHQTSNCTAETSRDPQAQHMNSTTAAAAARNTDTRAHVATDNQKMSVNTQVPSHSCSSAGPQGTAANSAQSPAGASKNYTQDPDGLYGTPKLHPVSKDSICMGLPDSAPPQESKTPDITLRVPETPDFSQPLFMSSDIATGSAPQKRDNVGLPALPLSGPLYDPFMNIDSACEAANWASLSDPTTMDFHREWGAEEEVSEEMEDGMDTSVNLKRKEDNKEDKDSELESDSSAGHPSAKRIIPGRGEGKPSPALREQKRRRRKPT